MTASVHSRNWSALPNPAFIAATTLENRVLPAGNVSVAFDGADLVITGDKAHNSVQLFYDGVDVLVRGFNGTNINGGGADFVAVAASDTLPGGLFVDLQKGNDLIFVSDGIQVTDSIFVAPGPGNDSTVIDAATVGGDIAVGAPFGLGNDAGNDRVAIVDTTATTISVSLGAGHDVVFLQLAVASEDIIVLLGTGNDLLAGEFEATENILVGMGAGDDLLFGSVTSGGLSVDMEAGNDVLHLFDVVQNDAARQASINLGTGNDRASVGFGTVSFDSFLSVTGSKGKDQFFLLPGATLNAGLLVQEVESTAPYIAIADPKVTKQFSGTLKRAEDFGDFLDDLP